MSSQEIEGAISEIRGYIIDLLSTLHAQMDEDRLDEIVEDESSLESQNLGQRPERCVEDTLIWPTLETLGFEFTPRPYYPSGDYYEWPDFRIDNLAEVVIGENKSTNNFSDAKNDIETYLDSRRYEYGIATDGFRWGMYEIETDSDGRAELVDIIAEQDLAPAVQRIARDQGLVSYNEELHAETTIEGVLGNFYQTFNHYGVRRTIGGLTEFYDLYLEIISGDGEYQNLEWSLVDTLDAPKSATQADKLAFATLFIDRMAFLKLLADRDLLGQIAFHKQWSKHTEGLNRFRGSFYSQYLRPLFYDVLSKPVKGRADELQGPYQDIPHLNGGLFTETLPNERSYDIPDEVMKPILTRFIEGEQRTLINEAAGGSLLHTYTEEYESRDIAGQIPRHYSAIVEAYSAEIEYVESEIERTLRSFEGANEL